jgi:hypothetical protein
MKTVLTRNVGDNVSIIVNQRFGGFNCIITSFHPVSGCYVVDIGGKTLVFFEYELSDSR